MRHLIIISLILTSFYLYGQGVENYLSYYRGIKDRPNISPFHSYTFHTIDSVHHTYYYGREYIIDEYLARDPNKSQERQDSLFKWILQFQFRIGVSIIDPEDIEDDDSLKNAVLSWFWDQNYELFSQFMNFVNEKKYYDEYVHLAEVQSQFLDLTLRPNLDLFNFSNQFRSSSLLIRGIEWLDSIQVNHLVNGLNAQSEIKYLDLTGADFSHPSVQYFINNLKAKINFLRLYERDYNQFEAFFKNINNVLNVDTIIMRSTLEYKEAISFSNNLVIFSKAKVMELSFPVKYIPDVGEAFKNLEVFLLRGFIGDSFSTNLLKFKTLKALLIDDAEEFAYSGNSKISYFPSYDGSVPPSLEVLVIAGLERVKSLPSWFSRLTSLQILALGDLEEIENADVLEEMKFLKRLMISSTYGTGKKQGKIQNNKINKEVLRSISKLTPYLYCIGLQGDLIRVASKKKYAKHILMDGNIHSPKIPSCCWTPFVWDCYQVTK